MLPPARQDFGLDRYAERRTFARERIDEVASIDLINRALPCTCIDLSASGAKLKLDVPYKVPEYFRVLVPSRKVIKDARVVWREDDLVGVVFLR